MNIHAISLGESEMYGEYSSLMAASSREDKRMFVVLKVDHYGGHSHWFRVDHKGVSVCETQSLGRAIRRYNGIS
jgi:hypothetical protein